MTDLLTSGEVKAASFQGFSKKHSFPADPTNAISAAAYLDFTNGINLVSLKLPEDEGDVKHVYAALVDKRASVT